MYVYGTRIACMNMYECHMYTYDICACTTHVYPGTWQYGVYSCVHIHKILLLVHTYYIHECMYDVCMSIVRYESGKKATLTHSTSPLPCGDLVGSNDCTCRYH